MDVGDIFFNIYTEKDKRMERLDVCLNINAIAMQFPFAEKITFA